MSPVCSIEHLKPFYMLFSLIILLICDLIIIRVNHTSFFPDCYFCVLIGLMSVSHLMNLIGLVNTFEEVYFFLGPVLALLVATTKLDSNAWD